FANGAANLSPRVVAPVAIVFADFDEQAGKPVYVAAQRLLFHAELARVRHLFEAFVAPRELAIGIVDLAQALGMNEHLVAYVQEVVPGGTVDGPALAQLLARLEDLFPNDPCIGSTLTKPLEILLRIAQPVRMIDANAIEDACIKPLENAAVRSFENVPALDAQPHQRVDIEEAPVSEFLVRGAPVGEAVVLFVEQRVEQVDVAVDGLDRLADVIAYIAPLFARARQQPVDDGLIAMPLLDEDWISGRRLGQASQAVGEEAQRIVLQPLRAFLQHHGQRTWRERKRVVRVTHEEGHGTFLVDANLSSGKHFAVLVTEHGDEHLVLE